LPCESDPMVGCLENVGPQTPRPKTSSFVAFVRFSGDRSGVLGCPHEQVALKPTRRAAKEQFDRWRHLRYDLAMEPSREPSVALMRHDQARPGRTSLRVLTFEEAEREDRAYWHARTPLERLRHMETLRELNYGSEVVNQGLQRVLTVFERARG
jgi:hypothetical protein